MENEITPEQLKEELKRFVAVHINRSTAARTLGFTPQFIADVINGNRSPSDKLAQRLGYRRVVRFVPDKNGGEG